MHKRSPIYHSVGANAANLATDVATVQHLLNASGAASLPIDGRAGPITIAAIEKVQRRYLHMQTPDGRVDPNGETIHFLIAAHPPAAVPPPNRSAEFHFNLLAESRQRISLPRNVFFAPDLPIRHSPWRTIDIGLRAGKARADGRATVGRRYRMGSEGRLRFQGKGDKDLRRSQARPKLSHGLHGA